MMESTESNELSPKEFHRQQERDSWKAWWKIQDINTRGTFFYRMHYYMRLTVDTPVTWFREKVAEPLQDRYKLPFYHRHRSRVPEIDECSVLDYGCIYEANEQFRLDKMIDKNILAILKRGVRRCLQHNSGDASPCAQAIEDYEENELNFFIKYGELGARQSTIGAYMKQKHRLVWERRNPEVMAKRQQEYKEHKELLAQGILDREFWRKGLAVHDKTQIFKIGTPHEANRDVLLPKQESLSKDWKYYKNIHDDPTYDKDKDAGYKHRSFPWQ